MTKEHGWYYTILSDGEQSPMAYCPDFTYYRVNHLLPWLLGLDTSVSHAMMVFKQGWSSPEMMAYYPDESHAFRQPSQL